MKGPRPPERFAEQVVAFAGMHPKATREEWAAFATRLAISGYREAFARGVSWSENALASAPAGGPEHEAEAARYAFPWHAPIRATSDELKEEVEGEFYETFEDDGERARYLDAVGRYDGAFRLVVIPPDKRAPPQVPNK